MTSTIYASFRRRTDAQHAVDELVKRGFSTSDIHVVAIDPDDDPYGSDGWTPPGDEGFDEPTESEVLAIMRCRAIIDCAQGALKGALIGFGIGLLASLKSLYVPRLGFLSEGGASLVAMSGVFAVMAAGAVIGGVIGYFSGWDTTPKRGDSASDTYSLGYGDTIISVKLEDEDKDAVVRSVLARRRAVGVNSVSNAAYMG